MPDRDNSKKKMELIPSQSPTSATDYINFAQSISGDRIFLQLISHTPDFLIENHRTILNPDFVKDFINSLCEITDYYPKKPRKKTVKKQPSKKKTADVKNTA